MKRNFFDFYRKFIRRKNLVYTLLFISGLFLGWIIFHPEGYVNEQKHTENSGSVKKEIWTCSMHPQIRRNKPGQCPICGMDLIPLNSASDSATDAGVIRLSEEAAGLAKIRTSLVTREHPQKEVRLYGKISADERLIQSQVAHMPGRIEKLLVNFTGEQVREGQPLAEIYSPELVTAQQELIEAASMKSTQPQIYQAAVEKLRQWEIPEGQITDFEKSGKIQQNVRIYSNTSGVITARNVSVGDHVTEGTVLFEVADLSRIWIIFDAYESDLPFISRGNTVNFSVQAIPGKDFSGKIDFIDPVIDPVSRVARVRVAMNNPAGELKPEMFVTGTIRSDLEKYGNSIVIPKTAVLWTGKRSVVYVKDHDSPEPAYKMREVILGPELKNSFVIESGLREGEEIVTEGAFNVDAAAQLEGKPSMMNREK